MTFLSLKMHKFAILGGIKKKLLGIQDKLEKCLLRRTSLSIFSKDKSGPGTPLTIIFVYIFVDYFLPSTFSVTQNGFFRTRRTYVQGLAPKMII